MAPTKPHPTDTVAGLASGALAARRTCEKYGIWTLWLRVPDERHKFKGYEFTCGLSEPQGN